MTDYGIKVSRAGHDVKTAAGKNLIFNSGHNTLKVFGLYSKTINCSGHKEKTESVAHNLGYRPAFLAICTNSSVTRLCPHYENSEDYSVYVNAYNIYFRAKEKGGFSQSFVFKAVVFANELSGM